VLTAPLPSLAIPTTLHASLMARLDRLAPVRRIAEVGAVIGREFVMVLEERFPEAAGAQPEILAHHCAEGGLVERAVRVAPENQLAMFTDT
jgi:hypothetical protein